MEILLVLCLHDINKMEHNFRSSHQGCSVKKVLLRVLQYSQGWILCFIEKRLNTGDFL